MAHRIDAHPAPAPRGRAIVLHPVLPSAAQSARAPDARLREACGLAAAIDLDIAHAAVVRVDRPRPATLLGTGAVERFAAVVADARAAGAAIDLVVVDHALSPVQQRNLEKAFDAKVIDRTGLILEIFGARARTHEGKLQVELAALSYQKSRLVRSWTHLERQRGGFGFLGGPGESQLEVDRRLIGDRIVKIRKELEEVRRTRGLHRTARARVPYPVVVLVGYTNAGKSTLFNRLAGADVVARDQLFATLDPTMRAVALPTGRTVILSDTVGFISDLPTHLVAAFRATLEEVQSADVILHVHDAAHPDADAQRADVEGVLRDLGIDPQRDPRVVEVANKIDLLDGDAGRAAADRAARAGGCALSAATGEGLDALVRLLDGRMTADRRVVAIDVDLTDGATLARVYASGEVLERHDDDRLAHLQVAIGPAGLARLSRRGAVAA
ncbi:GTPase HflX [Azospirillum halopraeferens]|uniref:GTPase HflX n=1 Tax=Azospirillum halopraeferens TaxID=34010 RepID=UPI0003FD9540|nr:GTPase HflX [Azospirillum halopraeferens]